MQSSLTFNTGGGGAGAGIVAAPGQAYVDGFHGNNATAEIGNPAKPYASAQAAYAGNPHGLVLFPWNSGYDVNLPGGQTLRYQAAMRGTVPCLLVTTTSGGSSVVIDEGVESVPLLFENTSAEQVVLTLQDVCLIGANLNAADGAYGDYGTNGDRGSNGADDMDGGDGMSGGAGGNGLDGAHGTAIIQHGGSMTGTINLRGGNGGGGGQGGSAGDGGDGGNANTVSGTTGGDAGAAGHGGNGGSGGNAGTLELRSVLVRDLVLNCQYGTAGSEGPSGNPGTGGNSSGSGSMGASSSYSYAGSPGNDGGSAASAMYDVTLYNGAVTSGGSMSICGSQLYGWSWTGGINPDFHGTMVNGTLQT